MQFKTVGVYSKQIDLMMVLSDQHNSNKKLN